MLAFASSAALSTSFVSSKSRTCAIRPRPAKWRACDDYDAAVDAGQTMRDRLEEISDSRREQAERTSEALSEMSDQLSKIMAKLRAEAGMPPVADPPSKPPSSPEPREIRSSNDDDGTSTDEPYMDPSNFGFDSTAGWQVLAAVDELPENEGKVEFRIECDMNGCSIIEVKGDAPPGPGVRQQFIQSGPGFRVGYDPEAPKSFCGMVGNEQWLLALAQDEIRHFKRLCLSLEKKMDRINRGEEEAPVKKPAVRRSGDGMFNMRVTKAGLDCSVELESKLVWVQAIGQPVPGQYCIRAILMEGRQSEGFWNMEKVPGMLSALHKLKID